MAPRLDGGELHAQRLRAPLQRCPLFEELTKFSLGGALPAMPTVKSHMRAMRYQDVGDALQKIAACGASESSRAALRFLVLTAARTCEVRGGRWSEIDEDARAWTIPAARMKARAESIGFRSASLLGPSWGL